MNAVRLALVTTSLRQCAEIGVEIQLSGLRFGGFFSKRHQLGVWVFCGPRNAAENEIFFRKNHGVRDWQPAGM